MTEYPKNQQFVSSGPEEGDDTIDLGALIAALWRGKWVIIVMTGIAVLIGGYKAYVASIPLYRATAAVVLETEQDNIVSLQSVATGLSGDWKELNTQIEVLRSRRLMGKVVDRLDLINDPEFNGRLETENATPSIHDQFRSYFAQVKAAIKDLLVEVEPVLPQAPVFEAGSKEKRIRDDIVSALIGKVSISNIRDSQVLNVTVTTQAAAKSARIADTITQLYILNQIEVKFEATEQATSWLTNRVAELQIELETATKKASDFSAQTELVSVEGLQVLERQIKDTRDRIEMVKKTQNVAEQKLADLNAAGTNEEKLLLSDDMQLLRFGRTADSNPAMQTAFDTRYQVLIDKAALDLSRAKQQLVALNTAEANLDQQISLQGQDLITLQQLTREAEATQTLYEYFLTRLKETSAQQGIQQADARVISEAVVPIIPSEPRKSRILALSAVLGLMIGSGIVLLREMRSNTFRTAKEIETHTGYTVMGQIPIVPASRRTKVLKYLSSKPTSAAAEAMRNLRTSLMLSNIDQPPQVIISTSSIPGEGKTTNSLALAQNLIGLGKKVLLLEGDIRRRTLNDYFSTLPSTGLVSVLSGELSFENAVHQPKGFGADVLSGEKTSINAADLFSSDRFKDFMAEMRARYDVIIIDTPPVLVVPDARVIAQYADAILFCVKWDATSKHQVDEALRMFHNSNQRITGMVLSQISAKGMKRYGYGGRYGAYSGYGAKYYNS